MHSLKIDSLDNIDTRRSELRDQLASGHLKPALRRLHDFAADFGTRDQQNEAVLLDARLSQLRRDARQFGVSADTAVERNKIYAGILALVDEIFDHHEDHPAIEAPLATVAPIDSHRRSRRSNHEPDRDRARDEPDDSTSSFLSDDPEHRPVDDGAIGSTESPASQPSTLFAAPTSEPVFSCRGLTRRFRSFSLGEVDLDLYPRTICGLVGINGAGKSTLLSVIAGELKHSQGHLDYPGLDGAFDWHAIRSRIAYVQQTPPKWFGRLEDNLIFVAAEHGLRGVENRREVERILYRLTLEEYRDHTWDQISGGYKMRFELARALLSRPRLLVLDEPLSPLDVLTQQLFLEDLRHLTDSRHEPMAVILSSQNLHEVERIADQLVFLDGGEPIFCGATDDLADRFDDHLFELHLGDSAAAVEAALESLSDEPEVEAFGQSIHVRTPKTVSGAQVLRALLGAGVHIDHFRDISASTRRLFDTRGGDF